MAAVLPRGRATPGVILGYEGLIVLALEQDGLAIIAVSMSGRAKINRERRQTLSWQYVSNRNMYEQSTFQENSMSNHHDTSTLYQQE